MHPVANEVPVSTEQILELLRPYAVPGWQGSVFVPIRVRHAASLDVEFGPAQARESQGVGPRPSIAPSWREMQHPDEPTERQLQVAAKLAENADRFRLGMRVTGVTVFFDDGKIRRFDLETVV